MDQGWQHCVLSWAWGKVMFEVFFTVFPKVLQLSEHFGKNLSPEEDIIL